MQTKRIPTILGVFLVLALVAGLTLMTQGFDTFKGLLSRATGESTPTQAAQIANITPTSFTTYWFTSEDSGGAVSYGSGPELGGGIAVDSRDLGGSVNKYKAHFVKVSGLTPSTTYYFKIGESGVSFGDPNNSDKPYSVTTGPILSTQGPLSNLSGIAQNASGESLSDAVAIWQAPGSSQIAALIKSDGSYDLPVSEARTSNLDAFFDPQSITAEKIIVTSGSTDGTINCQIGSTTSLPTVKLGQELDCQNSTASDENEENSTDEDVATATASLEDDAVDLVEEADDTGLEAGFGALLNPTSQTRPSGSGSTASLNIQSGETVSTGLPTFSGKVGSKQVVKIIIHSEDVYSGTVIANSDGSWSWTPPANLTPGEHEVTITIVNANGTTKTVTRTFFVTPGQSILPITNGTPSAQVSRTPTPVPTSDELLETGSDAPTFLALTSGLIFIILSVGIIFIN